MTWSPAGLAARRCTLTDEQNFPAVTDTSEAAWTQAIETTKKTHHELIKAVAGFPDSRLAEQVPGKTAELLQLLLHVQRHRAARALSCRPDRSAEKGGEVKLLCELCGTLCVLCG